MRKLVLTTHVIASVGWIGALAAYGTLVVAALTSESDATVRGAYVGMELVFYALIPLGTVALVTGVAQPLGTKWGLLRHSGGGQARAHAGRVHRDARERRRGGRAD